MPGDINERKVNSNLMKVLSEGRDYERDNERYQVAVCMTYVDEDVKDMEGEGVSFCMEGHDSR